MFCPQCGQQQVSDAARFCSRCGFQLAAVSGLLATNGAAPEFALETVPAPATPKRRGAQQGGKLLLSGVFIAIALAMLSEIVGFSDEVALLGMIVAIAGFLRIIYALLFEEGPYRKGLQRLPVSAQPAQMSHPREVSALPPPLSQPARGYVPPRPDTADLAYRPSVTEGTTR
ncbi:MAG TPA: zinc ribbon domain-containing protein, partial [Pyrinomonadaceae bacterium]